MYTIIRRNGTKNKKNTGVKQASGWDEQYSLGKLNDENGKIFDTAKILSEEKKYMQEKNIYLCSIQISSISSIYANV